MKFRIGKVEIGLVVDVGFGYGSCPIIGPYSHINTFDDGQDHSGS